MIEIIYRNLRSKINKKLCKIKSLFQCQLHQRHKCKQKILFYLSRIVLKDRYPDFQTAFKTSDKRLKGFLTSSDVQNLLIQLGFALNDDKMFDLLDRFKTLIRYFKYFLIKSEIIDEGWLNSCLSSMPCIRDVPDPLFYRIPDITGYQILPDTG